ncbi:MAG TPA: hypothetical protein VGP41_01260 [Candidatus Lustribacter sp.]|jgi:hypothetical protein|nr:hypothetical protein [Candidatus Lustribacter sp.]
MLAFAGRRLAVLAAFVLCVGSAAGAQTRPPDTGDLTVPDAFNMRLVGHADLTLLGEGMAEKLAPGGRRIFYVAHESGPQCFAVLDVTDAAHPQVLSEIPSPGKDLRCNSLDLNGNTLVVAAESATEGEPGAGIRVWDVSQPATPRLVSYFDTTGPRSRGVHHVWLSSETQAHITSGAADFIPKRATEDDQFYMIVDLHDREHPKEIGRWWYPGQRNTDAGSVNPIPAPPQSIGTEVYRPHNIDVFPSHPNRAYMGYLDGGLVIVDISDPAHPKAVSITRYGSPGFTHTAFPIFSRNLLALSEEALGDHCAEGAKRLTLWDISDEKHPVFLSVMPYAANTAQLCARDGRYGAHNIFEDKPYGPTWKSDTTIVGSFFGGGVRVFDIRDPRNPKEAAYYVPAAPAGSEKHEIQINDVYVDDRGYIFGCDRFTGGLYILASDAVK